MVISTEKSIEVFNDINLEDIDIRLEKKIPNEFISAAKVISKKWTLPILFSLHKNPFIGFKDLKTFIGDKISSNSLARALKELQEYQLVQKRVIYNNPCRVEYLCLVSGKDLFYIIETIQKFAITYGIS